MRTTALTFLSLALLSGPAKAAIIVLGNYTTEAVTVSIAEPKEKARKHTIPAFNVLPIEINGPAELQLPAEGKNNTVRVEPYNAYLLIADKNGLLRIEGLQLPGKPLERDGRAELNPIARKPVVIPVTLLVDDVDPRTDRLWQKEVKDRFEAAAAILEAPTGFRFEFAGYGVWKSDAAAKDINTQFTTFENAVKVKPGSLAIGFTSRKLDDAQKEYGVCRGLGATHILVREWKPKGEPERTEVLVRYLAVSLGAVSSPDPGSVMRAQLGDGKALYAKFVVRLDPLNVLAINLIADQRRQGVGRLSAIPLGDRARLVRVYSALLEAFPGEPQATDYLEALNKDLVANGPGAKNPEAPKRGPLGAIDQAKRQQAVKTVVQAVTRRARENAGPTALTGDDLTIALIMSAADAAKRLEELDRGTAFLLGIGIALDDTGALRDDPLTANAVAEVESAAERQDRLAVLGNPTLNRRRDFCRRFALGCATGELLSETAAENGAINRSLFELGRADKPSGLSFPALAAEFSGIALARNLRDNSAFLLQRFSNRFASSELIPSTDGMRDGLSTEKFEDDFGGVNDERFRVAIAEIRKRIQMLPIHQNPR